MALLRRWLSAFGGGGEGGLQALAAAGVGSAPVAACPSVWRQQAQAHERQPGPSSGGIAQAARTEAGTGKLHIVWPGSGTCFFWQAGVMARLSERYRLASLPAVGSSGGGLVALLGACEVPPGEAVRLAFRLAREAGVYERPWGLAGVWRGLVHRWLSELLPADAAARCAHVSLVVTQVPSLQPLKLSGWRCRNDLLTAALASAHIPFLLDGSFATSCRGQAVLDGSFHYGWLGRPHSLVPPQGPSLVFDPRHDPHLAAALRARGPGAALRSLDDAGARALVAMGRDYAERLAESGVLRGCGLEEHARHPPRLDLDLDLGLGLGLPSGGARSALPGSGGGVCGAGSGLLPSSSMSLGASSAPLRHARA
ncbi:hypothetical protein HYH03_010054 [Edaphochlamys debaryana]|uniref:PNPLA domain-containing protein n=1 Tax=Edaphochlamys debaryana TaxID=47281 RepID=A0A835XWW4_9CHLO|nr:hypothetical protein HYH03_010054 [Edaphochlamys debaryana]|eukprot:KAG2491686.1 hypothetical protein HYH03_010054 [Edaphochlamys debaryana]